MSTPRSEASAPQVLTADERRAKHRENGRWPESRVVRTGVSPMNSKVKWAELSCGHDVFRLRKPKIGAVIVCEKCGEKPHD